MSYEQAVKHSRNHRKDRFYQQCSGYSSHGKSIDPYITGATSEENYKRHSQESIQTILSVEHKFPIYLRQCSIGIWRLVDKRDLFGNVVNTREELEQFANDYC